MGEYRLGGFSSGELRAGLKGNLKTFAGNMAVSGRGKLLLFSEFKDRNGGDGGWAWRNDSVGVAWAWWQQLSIKGKQAKSSHFLSKKVKETFFLLFFLLTLLVFF